MTCTACTAPAGRREPPVQVRREVGFTMVELLMVVAIISTVAAVAVPGMTRARAAALESSAVGTLRAVNSAQASYAASCASGFYAASMLWLTRPPIGGSAAFIGPDFNRNTLRRRGYRFRFRRGWRARGNQQRSCNGLRPRRSVRNYTFSADPLLRDGSRHFATNQAGTLYESPRRIRIRFQGAPPPPARPLQ